MSKALAAGSCALSIAAVALAAWTAAENRALRHQLEAQQILAPAGDPGLVDGGPDVATPLPGGGAAPASLPDRLAALEARVAALPETDPDAPAPLAPLPMVPSSTPEPAQPGGAAVDAPGGTPTPAAPDGRSEAEIQKQVKDAVEKELESVKRRQKKAATFDDFSKELELNDTQQTVVQDELARMQLEVLQLLRTPTEQGYVPLDYLLEAWSNPNRQAGNRRYREVVDALKLMKLPGTELSYQQHIDSMKASVNAPFERTLNEEQFEVWKSWELDPSRISWTDSPFHQELTVPTTEMRKRREAELKAAGGDGK